MDDLPQHTSPLLTPDLPYYNMAISAFEKGALWEVAPSLLQAIQTFSLTAEVMSHNAAISAHDKGEQWEGALRLLHSMFTLSLLPNLQLSVPVKRTNSGPSPLHCCVKWCIGPQH